MQKPNEDIRLAIRKHLLTNYSVADALGWSISKFYQKLQTELPDEQKREIFDVVQNMCEGE